MGDDRCRFAIHLPPIRFCLHDPGKLAPWFRALTLPHPGGFAGQAASDIDVAVARNEMLAHPQVRAGRHCLTWGE
jgi:hypothetical protein